MQSENCALGCEIFHNFTQLCPGIENTFDPDAYSTVISGVCHEQCMLANFPAGKWWHYTNFTEYFTCFDRYEHECDYWKIYSACSPMLEEMTYAFQLLSFVCCLLILWSLYRELKKKSLLPLVLFLSICHNVFQALLSEEVCNVWAKHVLPKDAPNVAVTTVMRYVHIWFVVGALIWSVVAGMILLRITQTSKHCMMCASRVQQHKVKVIVAVELFLVSMCLFTILARYFLWRSFFYGLTVSCLIIFALAVVVYIIPACRAKHMQRIARAHQKQKDSLSSGERRRMITSLEARPRPVDRVQIRPFFLLLGVFVITYFPFFIVYLIPASQRTRPLFLIAWTFVELVGVWHMIAMCIVKCSRNKGRNSRVMRVWLKQDRLVGKGNNVVTGSHSFFRSPIEQFWHITADTTPFGSSCGDPEEDHIVAGDFEQSSTGELIRWTKRPSKNPHYSVQSVGLPLDKFELFVDSQLEEFFPPETLSIVSSGYCFPVNLSLQEEEQKLQLEAIEKYEEASLHWKEAAVHWKPTSEDRVNNLPSDEQFNRFEQAQLNWAYEETVLKLKAAIAVLLRWKRGGRLSTVETIELEG